MSTNMTEFRWFPKIFASLCMVSKNLCILVLWTKVALTMGGLMYFTICLQGGHVSYPEMFVFGKRVGINSYHFFKVAF